MKIFLISIIILFANITYAGVHSEAVSKQVSISVDVKFEVISDPVDVLFVIDNSGSMMTHQENLVKNLSNLVESIKFAPYGLHIGVVSTDMQDSTNAGRLLGNPKFVTESTPDLEKVLINNLSLGTLGSGDEEVFSPVKAALSEPLLSTENAGFYRPEAKLAIVLVTDAEDRSLMSSWDFANFLMGLKKDMSKIIFQAIAIPSSEKNCVRNDATLTPVKIEETARLLQGKIYSLCGDMAETMKDLSGAIVTKSSGVSDLLEKIEPIELLGSPSFNSIQVTYGTMIVPQSFDQQFSEDSDGWFYDVTTKKIIFGNNISWKRQPQGTQLKITYTVN